MKLTLFTIFLLIVAPLCIQGVSIFHKSYVFKLVVFRRFLFLNCSLDFCTHENHRMKCLLLSCFTVWEFVFIVLESHISIGLQKLSEHIQNIRKKNTVAQNCGEAIILLQKFTTFVLSWHSSNQPKIKPHKTPITICLHNAKAQFCLI